MSNKYSFRELFGVFKIWLEYYFREPFGVFFFFLSKSIELLKFGWIVIPSKQNQFKV